MVDISSYLSKIIVKSINKNLNKSNDELEIIEYGFTIFFSTVIKSSIILALAYYLGVFKYMLIVFIIFGFLRSFAGGVHAKTSISCLVTTSCIYFLIVYLAINLIISSTYNNLIIILVLLLIFLYAPADIAEKPVIGAKNRKKHKVYALITALSFYLWGLSQEQIIKNIISFSMLAECITITPMIYRVTNTKGGDSYEKLFEENQ